MRLSGAELVTCVTPASARIVPANESRFASRSPSPVRRATATRGFPAIARRALNASAS